MQYGNKLVLCALAGAASVSTIAAQAATTTVAYTFPATNANGAVAAGALPTQGLALDPSQAGAFFGSTTRGGNYSVNGYGGGVVFKLTPPAAGKTTYTESVLHAFTGGSDGIFPGRGNVLATTAGVYGTTVGNAQIGGCGSGDATSCDTVFKLTPPQAGGTAWTYTLLYRFLDEADGYDPEGGLIAGPNGSLYGTTAAGGNTGCTSSYSNVYGTTGCGTVFKLTPPSSGTGKWTKTILHTFTGSADGGMPEAGLLADPSGSGILYGTTATGGSGCTFSPDDCGVVFALKPPAAGKTAWTETVLYSFKGGADGLAPEGKLVIKNGALYGTAMSGGYACDIYGCGTVFQLTPPAKGATAWSFKAIYAFKRGTDGGVPMAAVVFGASGAIYGTTYQFGAAGSNLYCGSAEGCGTVFQLTPPAAGQTDWTEKPIFNFIGGTKGGQSSASLALEAGALFGTTALGGSAQCGSGIAPVCGGVVFKVTP